MHGAAGALLCAWTTAGSGVTAPPRRSRTRAQVCGGGAGAAWAHWEHSGRSREDATVRKKLTASDVAKSRLRVPGPLFELLFGTSAKVVLQVGWAGGGLWVVGGDW